MSKQVTEILIATFVLTGLVGLCLEAAGRIAKDEDESARLDKVEEASWESFPASDSPGW